MPESRGEKLEVNLVVGDDGLAAEVLVVSPQDDTFLLDAALISSCAPRLRSFPLIELTGLDSIR